MTESEKSKSSSRRYLGEILAASGLIDQETLDKALDVQKSQGKKQGQILIEMGATDNVEIARALANQLTIPFISLKGQNIPKDIISLVPVVLVKNYLIIKLFWQ